MPPDEFANNSARQGRTHSGSQPRGHLQHKDAWQWRARRRISRVAAPPRWGARTIRTSKCYLRLVARTSCYTHSKESAPGPCQKPMLCVRAGNRRS